MYWGFANQIIRVNEAKRFYRLLGIEQYCVDGFWASRYFFSRAYRHLPDAELGSNL